MKIDYHNQKPVITMQDITKEFSGVFALSGITFDVWPGEVHCLVGENGAGKSTLMKILSGAYTPTTGQIEVDGKAYKKLEPNLSKALGINIIYQENDLVPSMDVVENIYVGNEKTKAFGIIDYKAMADSTQKQVDELGLRLKPDTKIENLSVSDQQFVKILKALSVQPRVLIMDEPTSMFNVEDAAKVLELTRKITEKGIGIIYISHFLNEVVQIADRITVIRDGSVINTYSNEKRDIAVTTLTQDMVGRPVEMFYTKEKCPVGEVMLEVQDLQLTHDSPRISFEVRKGEIVGFSGMVGSGRTEMMRALVGADRCYSKKVRIHGKPVRIENPGESIDAGFAFITEDRQKLGLSLHASVLENATILGLRKKIKGFFVNLKRFPTLIEPLLRELRVKTPSVWTEAVYLSGGNQQKVVLAKWLYAEQDIYIFDEPTRGIDVNAKAEFYKQMSMLCRQGKCILMISSDMPELISMSDRVLVVRDGAIDCELTGSQINEQEIIKQALGVKKNGR
ncbi:MAG: sugar ABC transporter ATP-binding protein [Ruthenibacterium sp.]